MVDHEGLRTPKHAARAARSRAASSGTRPGSKHSGGILRAALPEARDHAHLRRGGERGGDRAREGARTTGAPQTRGVAAWTKKASVAPTRPPRTGAANGRPPIDVARARRRPPTSLRPARRRPSRHRGRGSRREKRPPTRRARSQAARRRHRPRVRVTKPRRARCDLCETSPPLFANCTRRGERRPGRFGLTSGSAEDSTRGW